MKLEAGQVAVVTGGASGLGRALGDAFVERGLHGVLADIEEAPLEEAVGAILAKGGSVIGIPTDVRFPDQVEALAAAAHERYGRIDLIVNNAGVVSGLGPIWEYEENDWEWALSVNLRGVVHGIRAFVPRFLAQGWGHVVNTASMAGVSCGPGLGPYMVSKHAVVALSEGLAADLALIGANVGVTVACPGGMATNIFTSERNRPANLSVAPRELNEATLPGLSEWMATISGPDISASDAADIVICAIENDALHVAPNGSAVGVRSRVDRLLADFDGL